MAVTTTILPLLSLNRRPSVNRGLADGVNILGDHQEVALHHESTRIYYHPEMRLCTTNLLASVIVAPIRLLRLMLGPTIPILVRSMSNSLLPLTHHQTEATPLNTLRARANQWQ